MFPPALMPGMFTARNCTVGAVSAYVAMPGEPGVHYGYGLMHFEDRGVRMVMHGGFSRGYGSMIQMAPAQRFAVIVVTNTSGQTLPRTCKTIKKMFLRRGPGATPS